MDVRERVRRYLVETFYLPSPEALGDDTLLVTEGLVDSTGMLEIIAFLEAEYAIRVDDQEATPENLETIGRMAAFVARKREAAQSAREPRGAAERLAAQRAGLEAASPVLGRA